LAHFPIDILALTQLHHTVIATYHTKKTALPTFNTKLDSIMGAQCVLQHDNHHASVRERQCVVQKYLKVGSSGNTQFEFKSFPVQMLAGTPTILNGVVCGVPHSLHTDSTLHLVMTTTFPLPSSLPFEYQMLQSDELAMSLNMQK
jgi:hypothetical protein